MHWSSRRLCRKINYSSLLYRTVSLCIRPKTFGTPLVGILGLISMAPPVFQLERGHTNRRVAKGSYPTQAAMKQAWDNYTFGDMAKPRGVTFTQDGLLNNWKKPKLPSIEVWPTALAWPVTLISTYDLDFQSPASYGHDLVTSKSSRSTVRR